MSRSSTPPTERAALDAERALARAESPTVYIRDRDGSGRRRLSPSLRAVLRTTLRLAVRALAWAYGESARYRITLTADVTGLPSDA